MKSISNNAFTRIYIIEYFPFYYLLKKLIESAGNMFFF